MNEDIMAWIDEYNSRPQPSTMVDDLLALLGTTREEVREDMNAEDREATIRAAHHAAEEAFWETLDGFFPGVSRAGVTGDVAVHWNDAIDRTIREALRRRDDR
jgi:hypothetical protein